MSARDWRIIPPTADRPSRATVCSADGANIYDAPLTTETDDIAHLIAAAPSLAAENARLKKVLAAVASALDAPRNRFGKLEPDATHYAQLDQLREFLSIPHGGHDIVDQAVMYIRAALLLSGQ